MLMRKFVSELAECTRNHKMIGNHHVDVYTRVCRNKHGVKRIQWKEFTYYRTTICCACDSEQIFAIDSSYGTRSTTDACNSYRQYYTDKGYTELFDMDVFIEYINKQLKEV